MEVGVVRPRLARQVEGVVGVRDVAQREVVLEPDRDAVEHDRVLELFGEVLGLEELRLRGREQRLGDVEAGCHEAEEALVARPLALVAQHLDQELLVLVW